MSGKYRNENKPSEHFSQEREAPFDYSNNKMILLINQALAENKWLYDPSIKRWQTPEEFEYTYKDTYNLKEKWLANIEVKDPMEGLEAANQQIESINARRFAFEKKILDYYKSKLR